MRKKQTYNFNFKNEKNKENKAKVCSKVPIKQEQQQQQPLGISFDCILTTTKATATTLSPGILLAKTKSHFEIDF